jgi:succinoglycan biosynthesis transport protein ExoP
MTPLNPPNGSDRSAAPVPMFEVGRQLNALWQRKWWILMITGLAIAAAYYWTSRQPRVYRADCTIEYDTNPQRPLGNSVEDTSVPYITYWASRDYIETQNRIISSRMIAERVVRKLNLHQNPDFLNVPKNLRKGWKPAQVTDVALNLQGRVRVSQERDTQITHIEVSDREPARAALLANAVADAYIAKTLEDRLGSSASAIEWLGEQLDSLKGQLERSELSLHQFVEDKATFTMPLEEQQTLVASDIQLMNGKLGEVRLARIELSAHVEGLRAANRENPLEVVHPEITANEAIVDLRKRYTDLDAERRALAVKYGDEHPQIRALDVQLASARDRLRFEIDGILSAAEAKLNEIRTVESGVRSALEVANKAGLELSLQEITYRRLERERDNAARLYGTILERTAEADLTRAIELSLVRVVDRALPPGYSFYPSYQRNMTIGALLGILVGISLALLLSQLDRVLRTVEEAEALGVTILGILPRIEEGAKARGPGYSKRRGKNAPELIMNRDLVVHTHPKSSVAECCRTIRTNLTFMGAERSLRTIVITSASPREGKTTVVISLAISLAQSGKRVLVVDTDLRKPRMHKAMDRGNHKGITTALVDVHSVQEAVQSTDIPGLDLLACGPIPPNPSELLHTAHFNALVQELGRQYDYVLFDSPPLGAVTDAAIIAPQVNGVLLVLHGNKTTREAARSALRQLRDVNARLVGGILNDVDLAARHYGYGSYYYYQAEGYYQTEPEPDRRSERPAAES